MLANNKIQRECLSKIKAQVKRKISMKKGYRKKIKKNLEKFFRKILYKIFSTSNMRIKSYDGSSSFGYDELGRDIEDGLRLYIELLKSRKLQIHTVIVLGSRAKGTWNPQSDVDVTIIASNLPKERNYFLIGRLANLKRKLMLSDRPLYLGIEPSGCCSKTDFLRRLKQLDIQVLDAIVYGQVIYDDGFWPQVLDNFEKIKKIYQLSYDELRQILSLL